MEAFDENAGKDALRTQQIKISHSPYDYRSSGRFVALAAVALLLSLQAEQVLETVGESLPVRLKQPLNTTSASKMPSAKSCS